MENWIPEKLVPHSKQSASNISIHGKFHVLVCYTEVKGGNKSYHVTPVADSGKNVPKRRNNPSVKIDSRPRDILVCFAKVPTRRMVNRSVIFEILSVVLGLSHWLF